MILQNLKIPSEDQCPDIRVYCLSSPKDLSNFKEGEVLDLTSYFNCFSVNRWKRYTDVHDIKIHLDVCGRFDVKILSNVSKTISETVIETGQTDLVIPDDAEGIVSVCLTALENCSSFRSGYLSTDAPVKNKVRVALNVCTYKRESYVYRKIEDMISSFSDFGDGYSDAVEMFIIDNAGTLNETVDDDRIHIFRNRNLGGSGGYARGIHEIRRTGGFTHSVFVDDDTFLDFESVYRLYSLLSYLKEEWKGSLIGGAMMRSEDPTIVYETSATMTENDEILNDNDLDVSDPDSLSVLDSIKSSNYNGWWFCCTPYLDKNDYPSPMFVAYDDVEYGARYGHEVITLNGISVWHDSFDSKYSVARYYYDYRNMMIARAMTGNMSLGLLFKVLYHSALEALYTRYDNSDMFLRGIYDFFKGPEFLESLDFERFNSELSEIGRLRPVDELPMKFSEEKFDESLSKIDGKREYLRSILTLNGILLPSKGDVIAPLKVKKMSVFYRAKRVLHCDKDGRYGFVSELDRKRALKRIFSIPFIFIKYAFKLKAVSKRYEDKAEYLHSEKFWSQQFRRI